MDEQPVRDDDRIRTAEVVGAACLATDLGMGFPFEHGLQATLITMRLAELLEVDRDTAIQTYYGCLLMYAGCTVDSDLAVQTFGGSRTDHVTPVQFGSPRQRIGGVISALPSADAAPPRRIYETFTRLPRAARSSKAHFAAYCEVAEMLAQRLGVPRGVHTLFAQLLERWDGQGVLGRSQGEDVPLALRILHVGRDAAYQQLIGGDEHAASVVRERAGRAFDPAIAQRFAASAPAILAAAETPASAWTATLDAEPAPALVLEGSAIDRALAALGVFADFVAPDFAGHSPGVARLAVAAAEHCGFDAAETALVGRAAHLHDLGRVAVHPRIWQKPEPLTADEREQVRLHPYHTERVCSYVPHLAALADIACCHHERLDGSGYHRKLTASALPPAARLLAAVDTFQAMTEPRPHRRELPPEESAATLTDEARAGRHDPDLVAAVCESAGQSLLPAERPAGLTEREAQVVSLLARGLQTKQVARALGISAKTADRHIQNLYRKLGVSSRAAATLFAVEHGLVAWGELPIHARAPKH